VQARQVIGDDIQQQAQPALVGAVDQDPQVVFIPQARVDIEEIRRIVAVVCRAGKDGRQPDGSGAQVGDVIQILSDAAQTATIEAARALGLQPASTLARAEAI